MKYFAKIKYLGTLCFAICALPYSLISSSEEVSELTWEQVSAMTEQIKFMGFQTWGPGKGDDTCSGYDEDVTPEYLMLEGGENGDNSVNFLVPWHSLQRLSKVPGEAAITYEDL